VSSGAHKARAAGETCHECSAAPEPGKRRCAEHLAAAREREAERREARKDAGKCVVCGERALKGKTLCTKHAEYYRRRNRVA